LYRVPQNSIVRKPGAALFTCQLRLRAKVIASAFCEPLHHYRNELMLLVSAVFSSTCPRCPFLSTVVRIY
jgi:hypothetical protein